MEEEQVTNIEEEIQENNTSQDGSEEETQETYTSTQAAENEYQEFYSEQLELTNHILTGQVFFLGLIFGVFLFKIFWDRWKV